jgi:PAS domain S-box-containing protein
MFLAWRPRSTPGRYATATAVVVMASLICVLLKGTIGSAGPRHFMEIAILLAAWWGGMWPGIYATLLASALREVVVSPQNKFVVDDPKQWVLLGLFLIVGIVISVLANSAQSAQRRAEVSANDARRHWEALLKAEQRTGLMARHAVEWRDRFDALIVPVMQAVYTWDPHSRELRFNKELNKLLGYRDDEMGKSVTEWLKIVHPGDRLAVESQVSAFEERHAQQTTEYRLRHKNGDYISVTDRRFTITSRPGKIDCVVGVLTDISRRKPFVEVQEPARATA